MKKKSMKTLAVMAAIKVDGAVGIVDVVKQ